MIEINGNRWTIVYLAQELEEGGMFGMFQESTLGTARG